MHDNKYTQAVDGIRAPESAVEKMMETARAHKTDNVTVIPRNTVASRRIAKYAVAAVLVLAIALGAILGPNLSRGSRGGFTVTVYAAELTKDSPACVEAGAGSMNLIGKDGGTVYYVSLPLEVSGEQVISVTFSLDRDQIAVICPKDDDPVTGGEKLGEGTDTLFDAHYVEQQEKAAGTPFDTSSILSRKYGTVTIAAGGQAPAMAIVGSSDKDVSAFYEHNDKEEADGTSGDVLVERAERLNGLIGNTVHCTVRFDDGSEQKFDIRIGAAVMKASAADPEAFAKLSPEEREMKDYTGLFVVYAIVG